MTRLLEHDWFPRPLPENVSLGPRSWLYSTYAFRHYRSRMPLGLSVGNDTGLYNGTFFDIGPEGSVQIGDYCTLVGAIICTNHRVTIGGYVFIAHEVVLADSFAAVPGEEASASERAAENDAEANIAIGENVWIGARAVLLGGTTIGEGAVIGAAAVVDFEVPPYSLVAGNPARIVRRLERSHRA